MLSKGNLFILSAPSGTGKTTLCRALLQLLPDLGYSISATTRSPRTGEVDGKDYFFLNEKEFLKKDEEGAFLESANVFCNWYGTPSQYIEDQLNQGKDVLLDVDVQGGRTLRKKGIEGIYLFLVPPNLKTLEERLLNRKTESEDSAKKRLKQAREELKCYSHYDYVVINDRVEESLQRIKAILLAEKSRMSRNEDVLTKLLDD